MTGHLGSLEVDYRTRRFSVGIQVRDNHHWELVGDAVRRRLGLGELELRFSTLSHLCEQKNFRQKNMLTSHFAPGPVD